MVMSKTPNYDEKIKKILDSLVSGERVCALTGEKWLMTDEEIGWYKKFNVPPSKLAPETRWKYFSTFGIGNQIWYHQHMKTGESLVTAVHPASGISVVPDVEWYASDFSSINCGLNLERPFFEQLRELQIQIPKPASQSRLEAVNSLAIVSYGVEDSYFVLACNCKRSFFGASSRNIEDSAVFLFCDSLSQTYDALFSTQLHDCKVIRESHRCLHSDFLFDCRDCEFCFGATNKRNKKYLWWNEQLNKEAWEQRRASIDLGQRQVFKKQMQNFRDLVNQAVWPENFNEAAVASNGEYLNHVDNMKNCYFAKNNAQNQYWCALTYSGGNNNAFCFAVFNSSDCYMGAPFECQNCLFCLETRWSTGLEYCIDCLHCENCFGCVGLQHKKFCIFNKQYSEEEYWSSVDSLKCKMFDRDEYGWFMPPSMSPVYFPDSGSVMYFNADLEFGRKIGANLFDPTSNGATGSIASVVEIIATDDLPDHLKDFSLEQWVGKAIIDKKLGRRFAFLRPELEFYQKINVVPPDEHYISRIASLYKDMNFGSFTDTECVQCQNKLRIAKNRRYLEKKIYCHDCYLKYLEENN